jgi:putative transposase
MSSRVNSTSAPFSKRRLRPLAGSEARSPQESVTPSVWAAISLSGLQAGLAKIRKDALHKLTADPTKRFDTVVIEDLNVSGMSKNLLPVPVLD